MMYSIKRSENNIIIKHGCVLPFYSFLIQYFYNFNIKIEHCCYIQNTFPSIFTSRQTNDISKKGPETDYRHKDHHDDDDDVSCILLFYNLPFPPVHRLQDHNHLYCNIHHSRLHSISHL